MLRRRGYCLWIGSGVTKHLTGANTSPSPSWEQLVDLLEASAQIDCPNFDCTFTERLEVVREKLGRVRFQKELRKAIIKPVVETVTLIAKDHRDPFSMPPVAKQISCLGMVANSIVNFNIESITSVLLAHPGGPYVIKAFQPPVLGASSVHSSSGSYMNDQPRRSVYHPHGCLDITGLCVLTESDYKATEGTLAFQLACHSAFQEILVIVGMSLEDAYLREQIQNFRSQIRTIIWFLKDQPSGEILKWSWKNKVDVIEVSSWGEFWDAVEQELPNPNAEKSLHAWHSVVIRCYSLMQPVCPLAKLMASQGPLSTEWRLMNENRGLDGPTQGQDFDVKNEECTQITLSFLKTIQELSSKKERLNGVYCGEEAYHEVPHSY